MKATKRGGRRPGGQPRVSDDVKPGIRERLRECMVDFMRVKTYEQFASALDIRRPTITRWFGKKPTTPGTAHILALAEKANIQPTWLLLGEGPQQRGASKPIEEIGAALHAHVSGVLARELGLSEAFTGATIPSPANLLREVIDRHRGEVSRKAARKNTLEELESQKKSVLAAALGRIKREQAVRALLALHDRISTDAYADVRDLPPPRVYEPPYVMAPPLLPPLDPRRLPGRASSAASVDNR
jgi:transcriptional regulator with XRE-family HTH domain